MVIRKLLHALPAQSRGKLIGLQNLFQIRALSTATASLARATSSGISQKPIFSCKNRDTAASLAPFKIAQAVPPSSAPPLARRRHGKCLRVRRSEGQRRAGQQIQRRRGFSPRAGISQGVADGQAHIRRSQLRQHRAVPKLHQGVNDALAVDHHVT
jgi:hypothetical protein